MHSAVDALEDLLAKVPGGRLDAEKIEHMEVRTYMLAAMLAEKKVMSSFGARFSVPFAMASVIYHGRPGLESFGDDAVANTTIQSLAGRVDLQEDESHTARYPKETPCDIRIVMSDVTVHTGHCGLMKGEPGNPHKPEQLQAKFFDLGVPVWGKAQSRTLFEGLMEVESIPDFRAYTKNFAL